MRKKALVLGASGGMGYALACELVERGIEVVVFARSKDKLQRLFGDMNGISIVAGDVFDTDQLFEAGKGAEVIFHAVNIPYPQWYDGLPRLIDNILKSAEINQAGLVYIDNIYAYGRNPGEKVTEETPKRPHTKKGKLRLQMEQKVMEAHRRGVPAIIAHFPDFYGPNAENTILNYTLSSLLSNRSPRFVGPLDVKREYIYTPDGAKAVVELAMRESAYGQNWNIPGYGVISGNELIAMARRFTGNRKKVSTVGKTMISFLGLFNPNMREVVEMLYLTEEPVVLSGEKYERLIGPVPKTSYEEGLRKTLAYMKATIR